MPGCAGGQLGEIRKQLIGRSSTIEFGAIERSFVRGQKDGAAGFGERRTHGMEFDGTIRGLAANGTSQRNELRDMIEAVTRQRFHQPCPAARGKSLAHFHPSAAKPVGRDSHELVGLINALGARRPDNPEATGNHLRQDCAPKSAIIATRNEHSGPIEPLVSLGFCGEKEAQGWKQLV